MEHSFAKYIVGPVGQILKVLSAIGLSLVGFLADIWLQTSDMCY